MKEEYDDIYKKYQRRIERFRAERKKPTCFIRSVRTMKELSSIKEYEERITQVIKNILAIKLYLSFLNIYMRRIL